MGKVSIPSLTAEINAVVRRKGITQEKLAKEAGLHQSQVSRILRGKFKLGSKNVCKLCKYIGVNTLFSDSVEYGDRLEQSFERLRAKAVSREDHVIRLVDAIVDVFDNPQGKKPV